MANIQESAHGMYQYFIKVNFYLLAHSFEDHVYCNSDFQLACSDVGSRLDDIREIVRMVFSKRRKWSYLFF